MAHRWLLALAAMTLLSLSFAPFAHAEDFTTNDLDDANSDGVCDQGCTLRDAVDEALDTDEADTINAHAGTHELDGSAIEIDAGTGGHRITINGAGAGSTVVDGNDSSRAFVIAPDGLATLRGMTVHDGFASFLSLDGDGGNILNGGDLTVENAVLTSGFADDDGGAIANGAGEFFASAGAEDGAADLVVRNSRVGGPGEDDQNFTDEDGGGISNEDGTVTLENTLVEGNATSDDEGGGLSGEDGGLSVISGKGGIPTVINLTQGTRVVRNLADDQGGGVFADDDTELNITDSRISDNFAFDDGGGVAAESDSRLTILRSEVLRNVSFEDGGGVETEDDAVGTITESTIADNTIDGGLGGGVANDEATLAILRTTIARNGGDRADLPVNVPDRADRAPAGAAGGAGNGGGLASYDGSSTSVENTTISANEATDGGGVYVQGGDLFSKLEESAPTGLAAPSQVDMLHVTLVDNSASQDSNEQGGGVLVQPGFVGKGFGGGVLNLKSTILANNTLEGSGKANCGGDPPNSQGTNLEDADTCSLNSSGGDGDLVNTNPVLGALAANGGPTETHALLDGSPAIHAANNSGCPATDQRNVVRPQGPACDIGAYEVEVAQPAATTTPAAPAPARPARPRVRVAGVRRACVRRSFVARFRISTASGVTIRSVRLTVDGRRVRTRTRSNLRVRIPVARLRAGRHRLRLVVTDSAGNRTVVNRRFTKCAQRAQRRSAPRFTG